MREPNHLEAIIMHLGVFVILYFQQLFLECLNLLARYYPRQGNLRNGPLQSIFDEYCFVNVPS